METVYQVGGQCFEFFEGQVRELQVEKSQGFITSIFWALTGSRHETRRRQVRGIPPTPVTSGSATPLTTLDTQATTALLTQAETAQNKSALEPLIPIPIAEAPMQQPSVNSQLGQLYIATMQVQNDSNVSVSSLDSKSHEYLNVTQWICMLIFMLHVALCQTYKSVKLCILYHYFVIIFCLLFCV